MPTPSFPSQQPADGIQVDYEYTPRFPEILDSIGASLFVTTYQAGKVLVLGTHGGTLRISFLEHDQPMGIATRTDRMAIGTRQAVWFLVPAHETLPPESTHDGCFLPRSAHSTGTIHCHDIAWGNEGLWIVNTLFSCLSTLDPASSFTARWKPPCVSALAAEDRCHLNGMAMDGGLPRFVTALGRTDTSGGWRQGKADGGVVMHVPSGMTVCEGLAMPHSPRLHGGSLWVLNSGRGSLGLVDPDRHRYEEVATMPGYTRGLAFADRYAFVGLSRIRDTATFGDVPIAEDRDRLHCGVGIIDLIDGQTVAVFKFNSHVTEIFAVELLHGFRNPLIGGASVGERPHEVWVVPNDTTPRFIEPILPLFACADPALALVDEGNREQQRGDQKAARLCYERAVSTSPECLVAWKNLGYILFNMGEPERAAEIFDARVAAEAPSAAHRLLSATVLPVIYDSSSEIRFWRSRQEDMLRQMVGDGAKVDATQDLIPTAFFPAYQAANDRDLMRLRGQIIVGRDFTGGRRPQPAADGRYRVGVISAYFRDHTIGRLNVRRLESLPRKRLELTVVSAGSHADALAARFRVAGDRYVELPGDVPDAIAALASLDLDLLLFTDVGMDALTSTLAFSRVAPVQVVTWGHPDTTGSPFIDFFLSSRGLDPADGQSHYTEQLVRMPSLGILYDRPVPESGVTRESLRLPRNRRLYACPQTLFKLHPAIDEVFLRILAADPDGEIVLLDGSTPEYRYRLERRFRRTMPDNAARRILFLPGPLPRPVFLALLELVDVILDPPQFGGGNSSLEAVALGRPIVTLEGEFLRSRITATLLRELGLLNLVATNEADYCRLAVEIATRWGVQTGIMRQVQVAATRLFENNAPAMLEQSLFELLGTTAPRC